MLCKYSILAILLKNLKYQSIMIWINITRVNMKKINNK